MSSTNINVGLSDGRNSSRVLKPPGGGHSNIFGEPLQNNTPHAKQRTTGVAACFSHTEKSVVPTPPPQSPVKQNNNDCVVGVVKIEENGHSNNTDNNTVIAREEIVREMNKNSNTDDISKDVPQQRNRVPPGGYSSGGFW